MKEAKRRSFTALGLKSLTILDSVLLVLKKLNSGTLQMPLRDFLQKEQSVEKPNLPASTQFVSILKVLLTPQEQTVKFTLGMPIVNLKEHLRLIQQK